MSEPEEKYWFDLIDGKCVRVTIRQVPTEDELGAILVIMETEDCAVVVVPEPYWDNLSNKLRAPSEVSHRAPPVELVAKEFIKTVRRALATSGYVYLLGPTRGRI